jgi:hypothetical protein
MLWHATISAHQHQGATEFTHHKNGAGWESRQNLRKAFLPFAALVTTPGEKTGLIRFTQIFDLFLGCAVIPANKTQRPDNTCDSKDPVQ